MRREVPAAAALALICAAALPACGRSSGAPDAAIRTLQAQARPIGRGLRFREPVRGLPTGRCRPRLGARQAVHVELFAENRVVLLAAGIGVRGPAQREEGRILAARCYGSVVTLDPTGIVLVRPHARLTLATLFRAWGEPLSSTRLAAFFASGERIHAFVNGRPRPGDPRTIALSRHAEIVLELGAHVPPHHSFVFPPTLRQ